MKHDFSDHHMVMVGGQVIQVFRTFNNSKSLIGESFRILGDSTY